MKRIYVLFLSGTVLLTACSKPDSLPTEEPELDAATQISRGKWQLIAETYQTFTNGVAGDIKDNYADMDVCKKDNLFKFEAGGRIVTDENSITCSKVTAFDTSWSFTGKDSLMIRHRFDYNDTIRFYENNTWRIDQLDHSLMKLTFWHNGGTIYMLRLSVHTNTCSECSC